MSDLFETFVFDLQRFAEWIKYSEIGTRGDTTGNYSAYWAANQLIFLYDNAEDFSTEFANEAELYVETITDEDYKYVQSFSAIRPASTDGSEASLYFSAAEAGQEGENILLKFTSGGGLYFDNAEGATIPTAIHFVDAGDQLKLDAEALDAFQNASNFYLGDKPFATEEEEETEGGEGGEGGEETTTPTLRGFDIANLKTGLGDDGYRTLTLGEDGTTFTLGELTVGDSFMFSGDIPIFFDGETEETSSVSFTIDEALPNITVAEGIGVYVATTEDVTGTGIQILNVTVNGNVVNMGTTGFEFFNGTDFDTLYIYDTSFNADEEGEDEGEVSAPDEFGVITFTINDVAYKVKGMNVNENAFVLTDGEVTGFAFAEDETNAMIIFESGLPEEFTLYNGDPQTEIATEIVLPTITDTIGLVAVGKTVNDDEEETYSVIMGNGTVADTDTTMTIAGLADDAVVQIVFGYDDDGKAVILGVIPANDPLTTTADAEVAPFPAGLTIDVVETAEDPASLIFADSMDAFTNTTPVSTQNGEYTFRVVDNGDETTIKTITLGTSDDTVYALDNATNLLLQSGNGSVVDSTDGDDSNEDPTYGFVNTSGSAYFKVNSSAEDGEYQLSGFVFGGESDAIGRDYNEDEGNGSLSLGYLDHNGAEQSLAVTPEVDANHFVTMVHQPTSDDDIANFTVNGFSKADTKVTVGDAEFIFGASTAGNELGFDANGAAYGISATSTVTMNDAAAALLADDDDDADPFLINGEEVDITANLAGDSLVFNADDDGEQSLLGLGNGSEIVNAGGITKVYGASGTNNQLTVGETAYTYSAEGSSAADLAYFTVDGTSATGFTFATNGDALKVTDEMTEGFSLADKDEGAIDTPSVYDSEGAAKDEYTLTKIDGTTYGMSGFEEGDYAQIGSGSVAFETLAEGSSAAITFDAPTGVVGGVSYLVEGDAVKVNGISTAISFDGDEVEIVTDSYTYNKTGEDTSAITNLYALEEGTTIKKLGGASYVQTAGGESGVGKYVFEQSGQSFAVEPTEDTDDEDFDGVRFVINNNGVSAIEDVSDKEFVYGSSTAFAGVSQVNGQSFDVQGAGHLSFIGTENSDGISQLNAYDGEDVVVTDAAGASVLGARDVDSITFADNTFAISGTSRAVTFTVDDDLTVTGLSYVGSNEAVTGGFSTVTTVNGQSFAVVDKDGILTVFGNEGESGLSIVEGITGGASVFDVAGASQVVTDTDGEFYFDGNGSAFTVEGDSTVTFQMDTDEDALVEGVTNFGDGVAATLSGALSGIDINDNDDAIAVTNDADQIFDYIVDGNDNATLGGVGASKATDEVIITGTGGASVVNVTTDGVYTFKLGGQSATFTLDIAEDDADGVNFVLDDDGNVVKISSFDKGDVVSGNFSESAIAFEGVSGTTTATTNVQVDGGDITVEHDAYIIKDVSDLDTIKTADGIVEAYTESLAAGDTLQVTDTDGDVFVVAAKENDDDGVTLILDGTANIVGVSSLAEGSTLGGSLSKLEAINGQSFGVKEVAQSYGGDGVFSVVGAESGIAAIVGLGGSVAISDAASAVLAATDDDAFITFKDGNQFYVGGFSAKPEVGFVMDDSNAVAIVGVSSNEFVMGSGSAFEALEAVNTQNFDVKGASSLIVVGNDANDGLTAIAVFGGSNVVVSAAASATDVLAADVDQITFGESSTFQIEGESTTVVSFEIDSSLNVGAVSYVDSNESVTGDFTDVNTVNGQSFVVVDDEIMVVGNENADGLTKIAKVSDGAVVNDVGGASQVITDEEGTFTFADSGDFIVLGDSSVTFQMNTNAAASVAGITNFATDGESTAMVAGNLNGLSINDKGTIDVEGDADDILAYVKETYEGEEFYGLAVAGSSVTINGAASATIIEAGSDGVYTFAMDTNAASTTYTVATAGDSAVIFEVEGNDVVGIYDMDKETSVTGDFSNGVFVEGISTSGALEDGSVQILNDSVVTVVYDAFEVRNLSNGASITSFTDFKDAYTDAANDSLTVTDADGDEFTVENDPDGVHYTLDGEGNIIGVDDLDEGATLKGDLGALKSVNGAAFDVTEEILNYGGLSAGDGQFAVVGGSNGIGSIVNLGGSVAINDAADASIATTDDNALITFKDGGQFYVGGSGAKPEVDFVMDDSNAIAIAGISSNELVMGSGSAFENLIAVNTQKFDVKGASALAVVGNKANDGLTGIAVFGGSNVVVSAAASAIFVDAANVDQITFGESSTFQIEGESKAVSFGIDSALNVGSVSYVNANESVTGNFNDIASVNGAQFNVVDDEIMVVGNEDVDAVSKIAKVSDGAIIANVGGASQVITDSEGEFFFVGHNDAFSVTGDSSVTFQMVKDAAASVAGINDFAQSGESAAMVIGNLNGLTVNDSDAKISVEGDADDILAYAAEKYEGETLYGLAVGGSNVTVKGTAEATFVAATTDGEYTFDVDDTADPTTFEVNSTGDSAVLFEIEGNTVVSILDFNKNTSVTGDFSNGVLVEGLSSTGEVQDIDFVQITGDPDVTVVYDEFEVQNLSDGASISSATTVYKAYTDSANLQPLTVTDASGDEFTVYGDADGVMYSLDGAGEIIAVDGLASGATLGGSLSALKSVNGVAFQIVEAQEAVSLHSGDGTFSVVGSNNGIGAVIGLSGMVSVAATGGASVLKADGNIVLINDAAADSQLFAAAAGQPNSTVFSASDGFNFYLKNDSIHAIDGIGSDEVVLSKDFDDIDKLNNKDFSVINDDAQMAVLGKDGNNGINAVIGVGNSVDGATVAAAAGASFVLANSTGAITFGSDSNADSFTLATDANSIGVGFNIDDNVAVQSIDYLSNDDIVFGNFTDGRIVNGDSIKATDNNDSVIGVAGNNSYSGVSELFVQANATVTAWGSATSVNALGAGDYVFIGADNATQTFIAADTSDSLLTFVTDKNHVTGVEELSDGYIRFDPNDTGSASLDVNIAHIPGQTMTFASTDKVSLTVDPYEVVIVEGVNGSVSGVVGAETPATVIGPDGVTSLNVNGKEIFVDDDNDQFNVVVHDTAPDYVYNVDGDATVIASDVSVRANSAGTDTNPTTDTFVIAGESYVFDDSKDENDGFTFVTDSNGVMNKVASLEGALVINDGEWKGNINGDDFSVANSGTNSLPVTVNSGASGIESVGGLEDGDSVAGDIGAAQVHIPGYGEEGGNYPGTTITINGKPYTVVRDPDGVDVSGDNADVITDLDNQSSLIGAKGDVTVNGTALTAEEGDVIKGDNSSNTHARIVGDDELIRQATAIQHYNSAGYDSINNATARDPFNIEDISGLPIYTGAPAYYLNRDQSDWAQTYAGTSLATYDFDQPMTIYLDNVDSVTGAINKTEQLFDMSGFDYTKRVYMYDGPQALKFNNAGGNLAVVSEYGSGVKNISLGAGGDAVVMDEDYALQNAVYIYGGVGDDSVYVRHNANTYIDFSAGGSDILVTAGEANARVSIAGYQASTGAAIRVEEYLDVENETAGTIADGIENGIITFDEGTVYITSTEGKSEIYLGTNGQGGQIVNLMTHATSGDDYKQAVGFTGSDGGLVDGSTFQSPLIMIGNSDNTDSAGSTLLGGSANDTFYGGEGDFISTGYGNDYVRLFNDSLRAGATVVIGDGRTTIEGMNNTLADSSGDVISVAIDPQDSTFSLVYNDSLQAVEIESAADGYYALLTDVDTLEGNYTTQYIYDETGEELYSVAIGTVNSTIQVTEDEDLRPNVFFGYQTAIDFRNYTGDAIIDLRGDMAESIIDETIVIIDDDITTLYAGIGDTALKGDLDDETLYAGKGNTWLYGDGGKNLLVGYDNTNNDKEGQTVFYVLGNEDGAAHTISGFNYVDDNNYTDNKKVTADALEFDLDDNNITRIDISGNDLVIEITDKAGNDTESALLKDAINADGTGKDFIVSDNVAQVAEDTLVFDQFADYYYATGKNATVSVSGRIEDDVILWLDEDDTGKVFEGDIAVIDATNSDATAQLAGNENDNVIYAGTGENSLWGGEGGNDVLVGNAGGRDTFYYSFGNGDDTITNVKDGDVIALDVSLDQIDEIDMSDASAIRIIMNDGDVLTINDAGHDLNVMIDNGEDGTDTYSTREARSRQ